MPSYALSNKYKPLLPPPPSAHGGGEGTESTEGVGSQEPPSASNAVGGATDFPHSFYLQGIIFLSDCLQL